MIRLLTAALFALVAAGCTVSGDPATTAPPTARPAPAADTAGFAPFTPRTLDAWLRELHGRESDLARRVAAAADRLQGQPYKLYLLGESPFELLDPDPLYSLEASDCLTFVEHVYAMALGGCWRDFFLVLQRIRYMGGEIGTRTRNHFTIADWEPHNSWLVTDVTEAVGGTRVRPMRAGTGRNRFFRRLGLKTDYRESRVHTTYLPGEAVAAVASRLRPGDMVQVIRGKGRPGWCGHVGLVGRQADGTVTFIHSGRPRVTGLPLLDYTRRNLAANAKRRKSNKACFFGYRFLRLREDPLGTLRAREGKDAPRITVRMRPGRPD